MKVHYPKLYNMAHLSLNVVTASKESNNYILLNTDLREENIFPQTLQIRFILL